MLEKVALRVVVRDMVLVAVDVRVAEVDVAVAVFVVAFSLLSCYLNRWLPG